MGTTVSWVGLVGVIYAAVIIYVLVLATRFVRAVETFVAEYKPRS